MTTTDEALETLRIRKVIAANRFTKARVDYEDGCGSVEDYFNAKRAFWRLSDEYAAAEKASTGGFVAEKVTL